jgi:hypothetical protein
MREPTANERKRRHEPKRTGWARIDRDEVRILRSCTAPKEERPPFVNPNLEHAPRSFGPNEIE